MDYARALRTLQLREQIAGLHVANRNWEAPAVFLGFGTVFLVLGAILFAKSQPPDYCGESCYGWVEPGSVPKRRAGLALMPIGALLTVISMPMLIVRASRASRLTRAEDALQRLLAGSLR